MIYSVVEKVGEIKVKKTCINIYLSTPYTTFQNYIILLDYN